MKLPLTEVETGSHLSRESHPQENLTFKQVAGGASESVNMSHNRAVSNITSLSFYYTVRLINTDVTDLLRLLRAELLYKAIDVSFW